MTDSSLSGTTLLLFNSTYNHNIHRNTDREEHADKHVHQFLVLHSHIVGRSKIHDLLL